MDKDNLLSYRLRRFAHSTPISDTCVFPKTDYTYSRFSSYHNNEISPGVMTLPNMSRPSLHGGQISGEVHNINYTNSRTLNAPTRPRRVYDSFGSDSDEIDARTSDSFTIYQKRSTSVSVWRRIFTMVWTVVSTVVATSITSTSNAISSVAHRVSGDRRNDAYVPYTPPQSRDSSSEGLFSRVLSPLNRAFRYLYWMVTRTLVQDTRLLSSIRSPPLLRRSRALLLLLLLLVPLFFMIWMWNDSPPEDPNTESESSFLSAIKSSLNWVSSFLTVPWIFLHGIFSQVWEVLSAIGAIPLSILPSMEEVSRVVTDVLKAPGRFLFSLWDLILSIGSSVVSLLGMILTSFAGSENSTISSETPPLSVPVGTTPLTLEDKNLQAIVAAVMKNRENELLMEINRQMILRETALRESIRAELAAKEAEQLARLRDENVHFLESDFNKNIESSEARLRHEFQAELKAREDVLRNVMAEQSAAMLASFQNKANVDADIHSKENAAMKAAQLKEKTHLQDELRRLWRRVGSCCGRVPSTSVVGALKESVREEVKSVLESPEALILLGAAASQSQSVNQRPQFNESEIRAWVRAAFLDKDDFERALANITRHFYEELDRRNAIMMSATSDEINAHLTSQQHQHFSQMSELHDALSHAQWFDREHRHSTKETAASFDDTRVKRIVESALALYDADKTGMADYALESQGGQIISTRCTETYQVKSPTLSVFGVPLWYPSNSPRTVIQPGMHPGECWAFVGSQGYLVIQLSHQIQVKGFTYEHISPVLLPTGKMDSAPKEFSVYGLRTEGDMEPILLGNYHYLENGTSMQYFSVQRANVQPLQLIELQIKSNHGNINYTCMYRWRVHGTIAS